MRQPVASQDSTGKRRRVSRRTACTAQPGPQTVLRGVPCRPGAGMGAETMCAAAMGAETVCTAGMGAEIVLAETMCAAMGGLSARMLTRLMLTCRLIWRAAGRVAEAVAHPREGTPRPGIRPPKLGMAGKRTTGKGMAAERPACERMTRKGAVCERPASKGTAREGPPGRRPPAAASEPFSGRAFGQTEAQGQHGAGQEYHVSHLRHATLQSAQYYPPATRIIRQPPAPSLAY
jgi:hypothetical protein